MTKDEFFARVESELAVDEGKTYDQLFEAVLAGLVLADLEARAAAADEDLTLVHHGDEAIGGWVVSLGTTSATGPGFLGATDMLIDGMYEPDYDDLVGPCGGWS